MKRSFTILLLVSLTVNAIFLIVGFYHIQDTSDYINIKDFFLVFSPETKLQRQQSDGNYQIISLLDERLRVHGLPWFHEDKPFLGRLPKRLKDKIRPRLWELSERPSGGRIRFKTDSNTIGIQATCFDLARPPHMTGIMKNGIDLYVNDHYAGSVYPDRKGNIFTFWPTIETNPSLHHITLYLPLYGAIRITGILLEQDAHMEAADDFPEIGPVVYYGSSITQGGCASNPGLSYPAILSRRLGVDFINLGFSGNGLGDPEIARLITEIDCSAVVLDYWANPAPEDYKQSLPYFVDIIRTQHKNIPILIISPFYTLKQKFSHTEKRQIAFEFVQQRRAEGDFKLIFVEGKAMISEETAYGLVDGTHANSLGFWLCANALAPILQEALALEDAYKR